jgi:hypothetical protein
MIYNRRDNGTQWQGMAKNQHQTENKESLRSLGNLGSLGSLVGASKPKRKRENLT